MADEKEIIISVKTDASSAVADVDQLKSKLDGVNNVPIDKPFKTFKAEIKEAVNDAKRLEEQFGKNSIEFANAAKKVAELKDRFGEFNETIKGFNPDNKLQALVSISTAAIGTVQGLTGAMTFLGVESDTAAVAIAKLQGLMAFSDALSRVDDIKNGFKNLGSVIGIATFQQKANNAATIAATEIQKLFGASVIGTGRAFNILKGAIIATGIGALIVGVGLLIQKISEWNDETDEAKEAQDRLRTSTDLLNQSIDFQIDRLKRLSSERIAQLQSEGASDKVIYQERIKLIDEEIEKLKEKEAITLKEAYALKTGSEEAQAKYKDANDYYYQQEALKSQKKILGYEQDKKDRDKALEEEKKEADKRKGNEKEVSDFIKSTSQEVLLSKLSAFEREITELRNKYAKYLQIVKAGSEEEKRLFELYEQEKAGIRNKYAPIVESPQGPTKAGIESIGENEESKRNKRIEVTGANSNLAEANLLKVGRDNQANEDDPAELAKQKLQTIFDAQIEVENANYEAKKARAAGNAAELELIEQQHLTNVQGLNQEHADAVKNIDERAYEAKVATVNAVGSLLGQASALAGKSTVAGKAFAVAQTTIDTYKSATSAFAGMTSSIPGPVGIALGVAAAAFAVASGVANIKKILSVKVPQVQGSGAGPLPTPAIASAPQVSAASTLQQQIQNVRVTNNPKQEPIRAYITNSDLQTNQQKNNFLNNVSTF